MSHISTARIKVDLYLYIKGRIKGILATSLELVVNACKVMLLISFQLVSRD